MVSKKQQDYDVADWDPRRIMFDAYDIPQGHLATGLTPKPDVPPSYARIFVCPTCAIREVNAFEVLVARGKVWFLQSECSRCGDKSYGESIDAPFGLIVRHSDDPDDKDVIAPFVIEGKLIWHRYVYVDGKLSPFFYAPYRTLHQATRTCKDVNLKAALDILYLNLECSTNGRLQVRLLSERHSPARRVGV
jgi:hypothetical protein